MNGTQSDEKLVSADGISVRKSLDPDQYHHPAIVFELKSDRDEPTHIRLVDNTPESIPMENIGFHPDYGGDAWEKRKDQIVFEGWLDPGRESTVIYAVRGIDFDENTELLLSQPKVEVTPISDSSSNHLEFEEDQDNPGQIALRHGDFNTAQEYYQENLSNTRKNEDYSGEARNLRGLGDVARMRGDHQAAEEYYNESLDIYREFSDPTGEAQSLKGLGQVALSRRNYDKAEQNFKRSLSNFRENDDRSGEIQILNLLGSIALGRENPDSAGKYFQQSLKINSQIGDRYSEALSLGGLGRVNKTREDYDTAEQHHQASLEICREFGYRFVEAESLRNLGLIANLRGDPATAEEYIQQSLDIFREIGARRKQAKSLLDRGTVEFEGMNFNSAEQHLQESLSIYRKVNDRHGQAVCLNTLGRFVEGFWNLEDASKSWGYVNEGLSIFREIGDRRGQADSLCQFGNIAFAKGEIKKKEHFDSTFSDDRESAEIREAIGHYDDAEDYYQASRDISHEIDYRYGQAYALAGLGWVAWARNELDTAEQCFQNGLTILEGIANRRVRAGFLVNLFNVARSRGNDQTARVRLESAAQHYFDVGPLTRVYSLLPHLIDVCGDDHHVANNWCEQGIEIAKRYNNNEVVKEFRQMQSEIGDQYVEEVEEVEESGSGKSLRNRFRNIFG